VLIKPLTIALAGKGGTGKTSTTALLLRNILEQDSNCEEILVVDADPASNMPDILGVKCNATIGSVLDRKKESLRPGSEVDCRLMRDEVLDAIGHGDGFDYLVMGRTTGTGCYCPLNTVLRRMLDEVVKLYDLVLIDFDAGLEHFSRQTDAGSDVLVVVTDPSRMGFETARRIRQLTDEVGNNYRRRFLVGSRFTSDTQQLFFAYAGTTGLTPLGTIPFDSQLVSLNLAGQSIFQLDPSSQCYQTIATLWDKLTKEI
jgi:CO dehydrogenase maturation factor